MLEALLYITRSRQDSAETLREVRRISKYVWNRFYHSIFEPLDTERLEDKRHALNLLTEEKSQVAKISSKTKKE